MFSQKAWEKSAGSTPLSAHPPTPSATPKAKLVEEFLCWLMKYASWPEAGRWLRGRRRRFAEGGVEGGWKVVVWRTGLNGTSFAV